ncbi:SDR family NAD(P)-dependent oxidoreductase [Pseudarthrobacter phenanthrenivorans]|uniref:SDR family NAD(P)-dependent oxidoreductase n=1 Tax=Pseudarthrobacter phenanthrenivorans TaxID=361575 RepID=UPI00344B20A8
MTSLNGATVLVTGANGGIGTEFVRQALVRGAAKVYASARHPRAWGDDRIVPLTLDVTDPASIQAAAESAADVTVLINNAGASPASASLLTLPEEDIRSIMETNFFGPLNLARAFAPVLKGQEAAAMVNIHSLLSWYATAGVYSVSKAASGRQRMPSGSSLPRRASRSSACTSDGWIPPWPPTRLTPSFRRQSW